MTDLSRVARIGYGAMQLGDGVTTDDAIAVLRRAIELGVNHIDTASFYAGGEVHWCRRRKARFAGGADARHTFSYDVRLYLEAGR